MMEGKKGCCTPAMIGKALIIVGAINWGLVGLGWLVGNAATDWNVVHMLFRSSITLEAIVYVLVGLAGVMKLVGCKCKKCMSGACEHKM